jgi:hypothetical protein
VIKDWPPGTAEDETHFAGVDIRIESTRDLDGLLTALGDSIGVSLSGREGRRHYAVFVVLEPIPKNPTLAIQQFSRLLSRLPRSVRAIWGTAAVKEFDIGIQAGSAPSIAEWVVSPDGGRGCSAGGEDADHGVFPGVGGRRHAANDE